MKRIMFIAMLAALATTVAGFSPMLQTFPGVTTLRRIQVNAQTIVALGPGTNYVADLIQRGVIYEFSPQTGQIDLSRVRVRTARGEVAISSFLEKTVPTDELKGFKLATQAFSLGTLPSGTLQNPPTDTANFRCDFTSCSCRGISDCKDLVFTAGLCRNGDYACLGSGSSLRCYCQR